MFVLYANLKAKHKNKKYFLTQHSIYHKFKEVINTSFLSDTDR